MTAEMCVSSSVRNTRPKPALIDARTPRGVKLLARIGAFVLAAAGVAWLVRDAIDIAQEIRTDMTAAEMLRVVWLGVLTLLRVITLPGSPGYGVPYLPDNWYADEARWTSNYLRRMAARLESQGVRMHTHYEEGAFAGGTITAYAAQQPDTQLIALASNGRGPAGRLLLGNVAGDVFATAPTSVLLLHPAKDKQLPPGPIKPASYQTIMVPLDRTELSRRALERATTLAQGCHASLLLIASLPTHVVEKERLTDDLVEPLQSGAEHEEKKRSDFLEG